MDGLKDGLESRVVILFQCVEFSCEFYIADQHLSQAHKGSHDFDVDLNGSFAMENAGKHGNALFGEGVRGSANTSPT